MSELFANVAFNLPLDNLFTYKIPPHLISSAIPGKRVLAGFGNKKITGIIVSVIDNTEHQKLRTILDLIDSNVIIKDELMEFCKWISEYYCAPIGEVIFSALPGRMNISSDKFYKLHEEYLKQLDDSGLKEEIYLKIIEALEDKEFATKKQLERKLNTLGIDFAFTIPGNIKELTQSMVGISGQQNYAPDNFSLSQNYPNPFNPSTLINYELRVTGFAKLIVYDILGNEVATLVNEKQNAGSYSAEFDGSGFSSGIYFYKLDAGEFSETKRMILLK